ncbi:MAG: hypothetical protein ABI114_14675 [Rhodanobacter sp.]
MKLGFLDPAQLALAFVALGDGARARELISSKVWLADPVQQSDCPNNGRSLPQVRAHVIGTCLNTVPVDDDGELLIGGENMADRYVKSPERSVECLVQVQHACGSAAISRSAKSQGATCDLGVARTGPKGLDAGSSEVRPDQYGMCTWGPAVAS